MSAVEQGPSIGLGLPHSRRTAPPATRAERGPLAITGWRRAQLWALTAAWVIAVIAFWTWWLAPERRGSTMLSILASAPMFYIATALPSFYWFFITRARMPIDRPAPAGMKVAVITPCVPSSESLDVVEEQLRALAALDYPCDAWILDEGGLPEIERLALLHGVRYFSRHGVEAYHQPGPPFQTKTKAGNVNAWIDHVLRENHGYEVFVQFDIDHRPVAHYLDETLGHFSDPGVAWVQAPSVSGNLDHWTARGQAEQETVLQGPLQMGFYGHSGTPFIIGSHTSYRMSAIREIGGYQPTRAEDHLDTVVLAAHGYRGVYVPKIIATGDGPATFETYLGQQFAWAYSMVQIFLLHTPRLLPRYRLGQAFQFLMAQSWYSLWSVSCALLWVLPIVALLTGQRITTAPTSDFAIGFGMLAGCSLLMWWWSRFLFRPTGVFLSWRGLVLEAARWPLVLWAIVNVVLRIERPYMITPKGTDQAIPSGLRLYLPFFVLGWTAITAIAVYLHMGPAQTGGYLWLVFFNAIVSLVVIAVAASHEVIDVCRAHGAKVAIRARAGTGVAVLASVALLGVLAIDASPLLQLSAR